MSQVGGKAEKKVTNLTAIPITEGFLSLQCSWHQELVKHTIPWPDDSESANCMQRQPKTVRSREWCYKRICGLMIPPSVMGLQSLLAHSLVVHTGPIHPATHTWRFLRRRGGNLSLKMLKKHSRRWKNSLSEFQLGFQIRFLKMNCFPQINQALAKPLITDDLGFRVLGFRKRPAEITWKCCGHIY